MPDPPRSLFTPFPLPAPRYDPRCLSCPTPMMIDFDLVGPAPSQRPFRTIRFRTRGASSAHGSGRMVRSAAVPEPSAPSYTLNEELLEKVRVCFRDSKSTTQVVGAFRCYTITHKQFSNKWSLKAKVLCVSLKRENNAFKCRISTIKFSANEPPQVSPESPSRLGATPAHRQKPHELTRLPATSTRFASLGR